MVGPNVEVSPSLERGIFSLIPSPDVIYFWPMSKQEIITKAKEYAKENYENGMDTFVECYTQSEWEEFAEDCDTWEEMKETMDSCADVWRDRQADAENSAF
jgi:hypothetical protein